MLAIGHALMPSFAMSWEILWARTMGFSSASLTVRSCSGSSCYDSPCAYGGANSVRMSKARLTLEWGVTMDR